MKPRRRILPSCTCRRLSLARKLLPPTCHGRVAGIRVLRHQGLLPLARQLSSFLCVYALVEVLFVPMGLLVQLASPVTNSSTQKRHKMCQTLLCNSGIVCSDLVLHLMRGSIRPAASETQHLLRALVVPTLPQTSTPQLSKCFYRAALALPLPVRLP